MTHSNNYDLHLLGWHSFQQLCHSICRDVLGQTVESFLDTNDGGRDGAFCGTWEPQGNESLRGKFVIQCKFSTKKDVVLKLSHLKEELEKIKRLVSIGQCDCYVIITNLGNSGVQDEKIKAAFEKTGVKQVLILSYTWLCQQIHENKKLRSSMPRLYGLGDLSEILDERAYSQARVLLASLKDELAKVVITSTYKKASEALNRHGFVLLVGEPAAGKTTIASMLAMAALDQLQIRTLKLDTAEKVIEHWNTENSAQLFWIDDAFGVTQYEASLSREWNHALSKIKAIIANGGKIVMTSRDYIYNAARKDLKTNAFPLLQESQVVIDLHELTSGEKEQILYNHLKLGNQPIEFRKKIKKYLPQVSSSPRFIPEIARRISDPVFTKNLGFYEWDIMNFVEKQESFIRDVLVNLDNDSKSALGLIYMRNNNLLSPIELQKFEEEAILRMSSNLADCFGALEALKGSLVQLVCVDDEMCWQFKHPTIGDAYASLLSESSELLEIYLLGTSTEKLLNQVTCGDVGVEKAIILSKRFFPSVEKKLNDFTISSKYKTSYLSVWSAKRETILFLSRRCSKAFLVQFIENNPEFLSDIAVPSIYVEYSPEIDLLIRLFEFEILPEKVRKKLLDTLTTYAVDGEDLYILQNEGIQKLFSRKELSKIRKRIDSELLPNLPIVFDSLVWEFNSSSQTSEEFMERHLETLNTLEEMFTLPADLKVIADEKKKVNDWIIENENEGEDVVPQRQLVNSENDDHLFNSRSIFDDIDA